MIVDSSAVVAVLQGEEGSEEILRVLAEAPSLAMSTATYVECAVVVDRRGTAATRRRLDELFEVLGIELVLMITAGLSLWLGHLKGRVAPACALTPQDQAPVNGPFPHRPS